MIKTIHHISDIHIRLTKRHDEYKKVFETLYDEIRRDKENSIILVTGDLVHSKTELSPELVDLTSEFLKNLSEITRTIVILGNHDCNLNNLNRMDSITPIVQTINSPTLEVWKDSKWYEIDNLLISNMSILDEKSLYCYANSAPESDKTKIALYHGIVMGGNIVESFYQSVANMDVSDFDGFDMVLLGDIHKYQKLQSYNEENKKPEIWYAGSLLQSEINEDVIHGYLKWDVETRRANFVQIVNETGYHTIEVVDGVYEVPKDLTQYPKIRLLYSNTSAAVVEKICSHIKKTYNAVYVKPFPAQKDVKYSLSSKKNNSVDLRDVRIQNKLIRDYVATKHGVKADILDKICQLNEENNKNLPALDNVKNIVWIPKRFEFSNMFSYGEDNVIDFTKLKNVVGLFAPNASGKSSVMDALMFCIFDKSSRAFKASNIMNNSKLSFKCKFNFEIDGVDFWIERIGYRKTYDAVKVDVNFWSYGDDGEEISLNGADRDETNFNIRSYIGTFDDFVATAMSFQGNDSSFIDKSQTERKNFLSRFLDIGIFDQLFELASEKTKKINTLLSEFKKQDLGTKLSSLETEFDKNKTFYTKFSKEKQSMDESEAELTKQLISIAQQKIKVNSKPIDVPALREKRQKNVSELSELVSRISDVDALTKSHKQLAIDFHMKIKQMKESGLEEKVKELQKLTHELNMLNFSIEKENIKIEQKRVVLKDLESHEYDPNCKYCMNNVFVKKARQTKVELEDDVKKYEKLCEQFENLKQSLAAYSDVQNQYVKLTQLISDLDNEKILALRYDSELNSLKKKESELMAENDRIDSQIQDFIADKMAIEHNQELDLQISALQDRLEVISSNKKNIEKKLQESITKASVLQADINKINELIENALEMELEFEASQYYSEAISRDGVPYELIANTMPILQTEVNDILSQLVDFNILFNLDGKNVNAYIAYGEEKFWPIEMVSGMEKFVSSLAIRCALLNISNLSRPTFLAVDEGFGVLDADNINSLGNLFDYLKQKFDFVLIVSHIDSMKDMVDFALDISKEDGFSKIVHD